MTTSSSSPTATGKRDTGKIDLTAMVDYMAAFADAPLPVDYAQRAVEVTFPARADFVRRRIDGRLRREVLVDVDVARCQ